MPKPKTWIACALAAAALAAGCSSKSSTPAEQTTTVPSAKAAYIEQADALCVDLDTEARGIVAEFATAAVTPATSASLYEATATLLDVSLAGLEALPQPAGDESVLDAIFTNIDTAAVAGHDLAIAVRNDDQATASRLADTITAASAAAATGFETYGAHACATALS